MPTLTWRGTLYSGGWGRLGLETGERIGTGYAPDCPSQGEEPEPPQPVTLRRVVDVRPAIAVATADTRDVYLAGGFVIESPLHPLHRKIFRRASPNETRGWSCGPLFRRLGRVTSAPPHNVRIRHRSGGERLYFIDARTAFDAGLMRSGVPFLRRGMQVGVVGTRCTASGGRSKLVARSFASAGAQLAGRPL